MRTHVLSIFNLFNCELVYYSDDFKKKRVPEEKQKTIDPTQFPKLYPKFPNNGATRSVLAAE
jgi:hypothetical protein